MQKEGQALLLLSCFTPHLLWVNIFRREVQSVKGAGVDSIGLL